MTLTGRADGPPRMCPAPIAACADGTLAALAALAPGADLDGLRGSRLLSERAADAGLARAGRVAPGGSCRLVDAADGRLAVNLARDDDWAMAPAWLETEDAGDWDGIAAAAAERRVAGLVGRARLMGLAVAADQPPCRPAGPWYSVTARGPRRPPAAVPLVLDLSALWAGPLCGHLLGRLGTRVIKLESTARPDGARSGPAAFFDRLNAGKDCVALDFGSETGRARLRALIARADIVIESARPRGLRQLGIVAEDLVRKRPGLTWVSITGYGRAGPDGERVAFGDDAAVAAGLSSLLHAATGEPLIGGDAVADPLTGLHAALAAWAGHRAGGGRLLSVALRDVAAACAGFDLPASTAALRRRQEAWTREVAGHVPELPAPRAPIGRAGKLGVDTESVLNEFVAAVHG